MKCRIGEVDGDRWEEYCHKLLRIRHQDGVYYEVPSKYGGDLGVEGFTLSGILYQCYCPEAFGDGKSLYDYQRDKITRDIRKLKVNEGKIDNLVGPVDIDRWVFLTPFYNNKELIKHCHKKTKEVIEWGLCFIGDGFKAVVKTEDDYIPEAEKLVGGTNSYLISHEVEKIDDERIESIDEGDEIFTDDLRRKLDELSSSEENRERALRKNLEAYIRGQNILEDTQKRYPSHYERITKIKNAKEKEIEMNTIYDKPKSLEYLSEEMRKYNIELKNEFGDTIDPGTIKLLSQEAVSDWLIRCPIEIS